MSDPIMMPINKLFSDAQSGKAKVKNNPTTTPITIAIAIEKVINRIFLSIILNLRLIFIRLFVTKKF